MNIEQKVSSFGAGRLSDHWISEVNLRAVSAAAGSPVFIYSHAQLTKNVRRIKRAIEQAELSGRVKIYVPFFPNANPHIMKPLAEEGAGLLLQMPNEYAVVTQAGFSDFIVSPGHVSDEEIAYWTGKSYPVFLASLDEIGFALSRQARTVSARIDSLGSDKPGIKIGELAKLSEMLDAHGRSLECFEVYCGSGNTLSDMVGIARKVFEIFLAYFPTARSINFAGGHGFDYARWDEDEKHFNWPEYFRGISSLAREMGIPESISFLFEPARDVLADAGVLIVGVKRNIITTASGRVLATDGSRMLMPSAQLRGRLHNVVALDSSFRELTTPGSLQSCKLRGRSILRNDYILPGETLVPDVVGVGDYLAIMDVGAYCATQHMEFLNVPPAGEVLIGADGIARMITQPGNDLDKWRNVLMSPKLIEAA